jgi:hypothetical protein
LSCHLHPSFPFLKIIYSAKMEGFMNCCQFLVLFVCLTPIPVLAQAPQWPPTQPGTQNTQPGQTLSKPGQSPPVTGTYQSFPGQPVVPSGQTTAPPATAPSLQSSPSDTQGPEWVVIKNLKDGDKLIVKKPGFEAEIILNIKPGTLVIMVDNVDVTGLTEVSGNNFSFRAPLVMPAGTHTLMLTAQDSQGLTLQKMLSFTTRQTVKFEEAASINEVTGIYEGLITKTESTADSSTGTSGGTSSPPYFKFEGNWSTANKIKQDNWEIGLSGNLRYLDQSTPVVYPLVTGFSPANYLLSGKYRRETYGVGLDIGDVMINESPYTAQNLARRGGLLAANYQGLDLRVFSVQSQQIYGFNGGLGIDSSSDDHINGVSAGYKLLNNRMEFRTIYIKGGETPTSLNSGVLPVMPAGVLPVIPVDPGTTTVGTTPSRKEGEVTGFLFNTDFFQNKLKSEVEMDFSRYDPDVSDQVKAVDDKAWRVKLGGLYNKFTYEGVYEYIGKDYGVIGSFVQKDRQGVTVRGGATYPTQNVNLTLSLYSDNVTGDPLYPRLVTYQGMVDYNYNRFPTFPINLNYSKTIQDPYDIPTGQIAPQSDTDTLAGRISYMSPPWNIGFQTSYSQQDDKSSNNNDTVIRIFTLTPALSFPTFGLSLAISLNQTDYQLTNYRTDNYLLNLQLTGKLFSNRFSYELGNTYNILKSTNNSADSSILTGNFRLGYFLGRFFNGTVKPTVGLRGQYNHVVDNVNSSLARDDFALFLFISTSIPFSF